MMKNLRLLTLLGSLAVIIHFAEGGVLNIQSNGSGGFCFKQIPKNSTAGLCSNDGGNDFCQSLDASFKLCGEQGECIVLERPQEEFCKEACESSPCGKLCLQEHESKVANYCIKSRDHPNALPPGVTESNTFYCVCTDFKIVANYPSSF